MMRFALRTIALLAVGVVPTTQLTAAEPLSIPCGYFNSSGGYHRLGRGKDACFRYAPAGGCSIPLHYSVERPQVFCGRPDGVPTRSWYAAAMPNYPDGPRFVHEGCPAPEARRSSSEPGVPQPREEEVGPGLLIEP